MKKTILILSILAFSIGIKAQCHTYDTINVETPNNNNPSIINDSVVVIGTCYVIESDTSSCVIFDTASGVAVGYGNITKGRDSIQVVSTFKVVEKESPDTLNNGIFYVKKLIYIVPLTESQPDARNSIIALDMSWIASNHLFLEKNCMIQVSPTIKVPYNGSFASSLSLIPAAFYNWVQTNYKPW